MKKELAKTNKKREVALIDGNEEEKVIKKRLLRPNAHQA